MTQYKYALLRQEPGRLVVDLNVNEEPRRGDFHLIINSRYNKMLEDWQSSHVTIPVDKGAIQDKNYNQFNGNNERELFTREDIADYIQSNYTLIKNR